ncbi:MAG: DMT family transporter [Verrucomicrobia bacterium]|nr:DMT family transporter [Verrucomicrobiota bacterium]
MQTNMPGRWRSVFFLLAAALCWSFGGILIKQIEWGALAIAGTRSWIAAPIIFWFARRQGLVRLSRNHVLGGVAYAAVVILFVVATKLTTAANAILLQYTAPVYVAIISVVFLRERVSRLDWLTIGLALVGVVLFFCDQLTTSGLLGNLLALASGLAFALLIVTLRVQRDANPLGSVLVGNLLAGCICLPAMLTEAPPADDWIFLILMGTVQLSLSYILFSIAVRRVAALQATMISIIEPILNPLWVFIFVGETPGSWAVPGGLLVMVAVLIRAISGDKRNPGQDNAAFCCTTPGASK